MVHVLLIHIIMRIVHALSLSKEKCYSYIISSNLEKTPNTAAFSKLIIMLKCYFQSAILSKCQPDEVNTSI